MYIYAYIHTITFGEKIACEFEEEWLQGMWEGKEGGKGRKKCGN